MRETSDRERAQALLELLELLIARVERLLDETRLLRHRPAGVQGGDHPGRGGLMP